MKNIGSVSYEDHGIKFLDSSLKNPQEDYQDFVLRRLFEESAFFGSLADESNQFVEIEETNILRSVTRHYLRYDHTNYCFSGLFGMNQHKVYRIFTRAKYDSEFLNGLEKHFSYIRGFSLEIVESSLLEPQLLNRIEEAFKSCEKGLTAHAINKEKSVKRFLEKEASFFQSAIKKTTERKNELSSFFSNEE